MKQWMNIQKKKRKRYTEIIKVFLFLKEVRMSNWTYVIGAIEIDTFSKNALEIITDIISKAPKVTGSEEDMVIFVNQPTGYNVFCSSGTKWETRVVLTLYGSLRDRNIEDTEKELKLLIRYLIKKLDDEDLFYSISISDGINNKKILSY